MERLSWKQITEKYPSHSVGLRNITRDDRGNIESAEVVFAYVMFDIPIGVDLPETELVVLTDPCPLGAIGLGLPIDEILEALFNNGKEEN